jgi:hypothetical protein
MRVRALQPFTLENSAHVTGDEMDMIDAHAEIRIANGLVARVEPKPAKPPAAPRPARGAAATETATAPPAGEPTTAPESAAAAAPKEPETAGGQPADAPPPTPGAGVTAPGLVERASTPPWPRRPAKKATRKK